MHYLYPLPVDGQVWIRAVILDGKPLVIKCVGHLCTSLFGLVKSVQARAGRPYVLKLIIKAAQQQGK
jgi:hypothetical protein